VDFDIPALIAKYHEWFYVVTFIWTFLEGETFVIFAAAASSQGMLNPYWLLFAAWLGSFAGDQFYFLIGRKFGTRLLRRFPKLEGGVMMALEMLTKYDTWFILSFRFIYGIRNFSSLAMGMSPIAWSRFALLNFIAAGVWANSFVWAGYLLGRASEKLLGNMVQNFGYVMLGVFGVVFLLLFFIHRRSKAHFDRRIAAETARRAAEAHATSAKSE